GGRSMLEWDWQPQVQSIGDFVFFRSILSFLDDRITQFGAELLSRVMAWVGALALTALTLWILIQGYRIVSGTSRESMMALIVNAARAALIVTAASSMSIFGTKLYDILVVDLKGEISEVVTGKSDPPEKQIDDGLAWMQVAFSSIDAIDVTSDGVLDAQKTRALWFVGLGTGGPALIGGSLLMMYQIALALFIGLGPLFILCLLFDQTKQLFSKWLMYGVGTMFSMAVLAAVVSISLDMVTRVAAAFWGAAMVSNLLPLGGDFSSGVSSQAMQQGGLGLILSTLIISTPPMAAMFFQGTLGGFMAYSQMGAGATAARGPQGQPPGSFAPESARMARMPEDNAVHSLHTMRSDSPKVSTPDGRRGLGNSDPGMKI
ncbi:type IV secretion system protein, partial [Xanthomonas sp. Kuri4-2]